MHANLLVAMTPASTAPLAAGDLLTESEAAAALNVRVNTLSNWRWKGEGPRWVRIGKRCVRYPRADLEAFIEAGAADRAA